MDHSGIWVLIEMDGKKGDFRFPPEQMGQAIDCGRSLREQGYVVDIKQWNDSAEEYSDIVF
jgi:hypothetical protein